jgi:hypothetical protein
MHFSDFCCSFFGGLFYDAFSTADCAEWWNDKSTKKWKGVTFEAFPAAKIGKIFLGWLSAVSLG